MRRFVIGDIHGNKKSMMEVFKKVKFDYENDFLIIIGDVVDGYNDSYLVVEELTKIKNKVFIIGNHDVWWMNHMRNAWAEDIWLRQGGEATVNSYKKHGWSYEKLPALHKEFFDSGVYWFETDNMMFVHGGFHYPTHPRDTSHEVLTWDRSLIERAKNGLKMKEWDKVFVGHTTTENTTADVITYQKFKEGAKLIQVDCGAGWKGRLCLYNIDDDSYVLSNYAKRRWQDE